MREKYSVQFRFYEELNDFLPLPLRKKSFSHYFFGHPFIKEIIEAIGVPHAEIDLIIVNGRSVDFSYRLQDQDQISVYPVFESMDISPLLHLRSKPLRDIKFILDVHLGKLAKYLRLCGFDSIYYSEREDQEIIEQSLLEKRNILTRDKNLLKDEKVTHGYWVRAIKPEKQIEEILNRFDLYNVLKPFTRCLECNFQLECISKKEVLHRLEDQTQKFYDEFLTCPQCQKVFWKGSHYENMKKFISKLLLKK